MSVPPLELVLTKPKGIVFFEGTPFSVGFKAIPKGHIFIEGTPFSAGFNSTPKGYVFFFFCFFLGYHL